MMEAQRQREREERPLIIVSGAYRSAEEQKRLFVSRYGPTPAEDPNTGKTYKKKRLYVFVDDGVECWGWCPFHWYNPFDWFRKKKRGGVYG